MGKHVVSVVFLSLPAFLTVILLSFCLISDYWITINEDKLTKVKIQSSRDYTNKNQSHTHLIGGDINDSGLDLKAATISINKNSRLSPDTIINYKSVENKSTEASTTPQTPTTAKTTDGYLYDYDEEDIYEDDSLKDDKDEYRHRRSSSKSKRNPSSPYLFMSTLWPLVKFKSLYSECIQYVKLELKVSRSYLIQPNKAPIIGTIHYDDATIQNIKTDSNNNCPIGQIKCFLTNKCVFGNICDGIVDCDDQSDEQQCLNNHCNTNSPGFIQCDNRCWQFWHKCDQIPHCLNGSDEMDCKPAKQIGGNFIEPFP
jgi:hypothetical protein